MYFYPQIDVTGNLTVWLVYILCVRSTTIRKFVCVRCWVATGIVSSRGCGLGWVYLKPLIVSLVWSLTGVRVRSHKCDHNILTFVQRLYRIANIRAQVLNGTVLKRPAHDNSIIIGFFYDA